MSLDKQVDENKNEIEQLDEPLFNFDQPLTDDSFNQDLESILKTIKAM